MPSSAVDAIEREESTGGSRGLLASSIVEQKALRSLPALQAPRPVESGWVWPSRPRPEDFHFVVPAPARQLCPLGVPLRTRRCLEQMVRTAPDAAPLFPSSFEPAHPAPHTAVPARDGLPVCLRSSTWHRPGLSVRGGPMQVDDVTNRGLIHRLHPARPPCRCRAMPQRHGGIPKPASAEMREWDGSPFHF